jgi:hypothetical protein
MFKLNSLVLGVPKIINTAVTWKSGHEFCKILQIPNSSGALYKGYLGNNLCSFQATNVGREESSCM